MPAYTSAKLEISTPTAPAAIGPYSQAVRVGDLLFTSGQIPIDPTTGNLVPGDITEQTTQVRRRQDHCFSEVDERLRRHERRLRNVLRGGGGGGSRALDRPSSRSAQRCAG
jgi:hypothetical protein